MTDLFDKDAKESVDNISHKNIPLAEKLRPKILDEVIGQDKTCLLYTSPSPRD